VVAVMDKVMVETVSVFVTGCIDANDIPGRRLSSIDECLIPGR
jgi:hypothetical protein